MNPTELAMGIEDGKVLVRFKDKVAWVAFDPDNAFHVAEAMARLAHEVKFGEKPQTDQSYIAQQVRARLTEDLRDRMVTRVSLMLASLKSQNKTDGYTAMQIVDTIFAEVA
jgi:hypothetical protein